MKSLLPYTFLFLFIIISASTAFAQTGDVDLNQTEEKGQESIMRPTTEIFPIRFEAVSSNPLPNDQFSFLHTKTSQTVLSLAKNLIGNKYDIKYFSPTLFPKNVTEYNQAAQRQMFMPEPTSQQRRSFHYPFN